MRELTGGDGTGTVLDCVGTMEVLQTAFRDVIARRALQRGADRALMRNITLTGGVTPARANMDELLPDILDGAIEPGRVFDRTVDLEEIPDGYQAMASRESLKVDGYACQAVAAERAMVPRPGPPSSLRGRVRRAGVVRRHVLQWRYG